MVQDPEVTTIYSQGDINESTKMSWQSIHELYIRIKHVNLMVVLEEKSGNHQIDSIHPVGTMNFCTTFHCNPSNSYWAFSVLTGKRTDIGIHSDMLLTWLKIKCNLSIPNLSKYGQKKSIHSQWPLYLLRTNDPMDANLSPTGLLSRSWNSN